MLDLAVVILTYNEEQHLGRALASVRDIAREIIVVDSYSSDRTVEIAREAGCVVLQNKFVNQAAQFEWGMQNATIASSWIMRLDADEIIGSELAAEIAVRLPALGPEIAGVNLKRKHIFMNRWIRHGGRYPLILLRIWRKNQGRVESRWMDEHVVIWGGTAVTFEGDFADHNLNDLTYFIDKHNKYATREAIEVLNRKYGLLKRDEDLTEVSTSRQASIKRVIKELVYNRMPLWLGPLGYFLYRYFLQLGFLDGRPGLIYHFLQGGWYRFLVGAKVEEFDLVLRTGTSREKRLEMLERLTGYELR